MRSTFVAVIFLTLVSACKVAESGNIPCSDDSNCPKDYPQCIVATGKCTEAVLGTPVLQTGAIAVTPAAITGGLRPSITLALPAISGNVSLARKVTLGIGIAGGTAEPVVKSGGAAITLADLGTTITVDAPATAATDSKTYTYTLTVTNEPGSTAAVTATGALAIIPSPVLAADTFAVTPGTMTGGQPQNLTLSLPALSSPSTPAPNVSLQISGCGTGDVSKLDGSPVGLADLGNSITVAPPSSSPSDNKTCLYTLIVTNTATTPAAVSSAGSLAIQPLPVISASTFAIAPGSITAGLTPTLSTTLPALSSPASAGTTVSFTISGCGTGAVSKSGGGGAVTLNDLGHAITFASPGSSPGDNKTCTYTLTVSNSLVTASATGTLQIVPRPVLAASTFTLADAVITGGSTSGLTATLPALNSTAASVASVTLSSDCGGAVAVSLNASSLGSSVPIPSPSTAPSDATTCHYTLTVSNSATTAASATATSSVDVVPNPTLTGSVTFTPAVATGGITTLKIVMPPTNLSSGQTSAVTVSVTGSGCGSSVTRTTGSFGYNDLGNASGVTINAPAGNTSSSTLDCTYTVDVANTATSAAHAQASGVFHIIPTPVLTPTGTGGVTFNPAIATSGFSSALHTTLPSVNLTASQVSAVTLKITSGTSCTTGDVTRSAGGLVTFSDLGTTVDVVPISTTTGDVRDCTYTLTVKNNADTPVSTTATGIFHVVPAPVLTPEGAGNLTFTPAIATGGATSFKINMPAVNLTSTQVSAVTVSVSGSGCPSTVTRSGVGGFVFADLNKALTVDAPTLSTTTTLDCTYTVDVANTATSAAHDTVSGVFHVVPATVLTPSGVGGITFTPAIATGGSIGATFQINLPSVNLTSTQATSISLTASGAGCNPGAVSKHSGGSIAYTDLGQGIQVDPPTNTSSTTLDCTYTLSVSNTGTPVSTVTASGVFHIIPAAALSPTGVGGVTFTPATMTGGASTTLQINLPSVNLSSTQVSSVTVSISGAGCGTTVTKNPSNSSTFVYSDLGTAVTINAPASDNTTTLDCTYSVSVSSNATTPTSDSASGIFHVVPAPQLSSHSLTLSPSSITAGTSPDISVSLPSATGAAGVTFKVSGGSVCGSGVTVSKTGGGSGGTGAVVLADLGNASAIIFKPPTSTTENVTCTYTLTVSNSATSAATDSASGTLTIVGAPVFTSSLTVTPNVLAAGTSTAGLLQFPLPTASPAATSIAMTVTPAGGSPTAVTKTGAVALTKDDLGTTISVDPPSTGSITASKVYTYSLTATNGAGTSNPTTIPVTAYPTGVTAQQAARIASTATLLPSGKVLILGGGTGISGAGSLCAGATKHAELYDPAAGTSTALSDMSVARCQHTATLVGTKVYVMGGAASKNIDVFNTADNTWQAGPGLPTLAIARAGHSATLLGSASINSSGTIDNRNKIAIVGGYVPSGGSAGTGLDTLELFDPSTATSSQYKFNSGTATTMFKQRGDHAAVLMGPWLFIIGGFDGSTNFSSSIDALDTTRAVQSSLSASQIVTSSGLTNAQGRIGHSAIALDSTTMLVVGGYNGTSLLTSFQKYTVDPTTAGTNTTSGQVTSITAISTPTNLTTARMYFPLLAAGPLNKYMVFGGTSTLGAPNSATTSIEVIDASAMTASTYASSLLVGRQSYQGVNLTLTGASNFAFVLGGGINATANGFDFIVGP